MDGSSLYFSHDHEYESGDELTVTDDAQNEAVSPPPWSQKGIIARSSKIWTVFTEVNVKDKDGKDVEKSRMQIL